LKIPYVLDFLDILQSLSSWKEVGHLIFWSRCFANGVLKKLLNQQALSFQIPEVRKGIPYDF